MKNIVIGTAGHVDHGKTTLVKSLTGVDTDRLLEEKPKQTYLKTYTVIFSWLAIERSHFSPLFI